MKTIRAIADQYAGKSCKLHTLDGEKPAIIAGRLNQFATVASLDGQCSITINWKAVERKMESDQLFYAC